MEEEEDGMHWHLSLNLNLKKSSCQVTIAAAAAAAAAHVAEHDVSLPQGQIQDYPRWAERDLEENLAAVQLKPCARSCCWHDLFLQILVWQLPCLTLAAELQAFQWQDSHAS